MSSISETLNKLFSGGSHVAEGILQKSIPIVHAVDGIAMQAAPIAEVLLPQYVTIIEAAKHGIAIADQFAQSKAGSGDTPPSGPELKAMAVGATVWKLGFLDLTPEAIAILPKLIQAVFDAIKLGKAFHDARTHTGANA